MVIVRRGSTVFFLCFFAAYIRWKSKRKKFIFEQLFFFLQQKVLGIFFVIIYHDLNSLFAPHPSSNHNLSFKFAL